MRQWIALIAISMGAVFAPAHANDMHKACEAKAVEKKLYGAARNSFIQKCEKDAVQGGCAAMADEKKLHGAARNSFVKKCKKDASAHKH
ncbi:hypothetical protein GTZ97_13140 [Aquabacterium fontiphilum]|uniref:hypothetical protein n=1 Tax=Aquabacterium fontiphilum TaxID=450365 RepID=UPI001378B358|nr:hypothetical protein [Aquabacterium fontiphilum]NBD21611.1 hypothetical protein [Aquabacterium fontiphilum]